MSAYVALGLDEMYAVVVCLSYKFFSGGLLPCAGPFIEFEDDAFKACRGEHKQDMSDATLT